MLAFGLVDNCRLMLPFVEFMKFNEIQLYVNFDNHWMPKTNNIYNLNSRTVSKKKNLTQPLTEQVFHFAMTYFQV